MFVDEKATACFLGALSTPAAHTGYRCSELIDKYGVTTLNVTHAGMTARNGMPLKLASFVKHPQLLADAKKGMGSALGVE